MDPIETWHDAPTFEAMEKRIKTLEDAVRAYRALCACYRLGKKPSEKLFKQLDKACFVLEPPLERK